jgi:hypothetical protein
MNGIFHLPALRDVVAQFQYGGRETMSIPLKRPAAVDDDLYSLSPGVDQLSLPVTQDLKLTPDRLS